MIIVTGTNENYLTKLETERGTLYPTFIDVPESRGGENTYMRPGETLLGALGACINITTRRCLNRDHLPYDRVEVRVWLKQQDDVTHIFTHLEIYGALSAADKSRISEEVKECPVCKLVSGEIKLHMNCPENN